MLALLILAVSGVLVWTHDAALATLGAAIVICRLGPQRSHVHARGIRIHGITNKRIHAKPRFESRRSHDYKLLDVARRPSCHLAK